MEKIDEQLKNLAQIDTPIEIHRSVMNRIHNKKIQPMLFFVLGLLVFNFAIIAWHINGKLVKAEFGDMLADFFTDFTLTFYLISTILKSFFEIVSPALVLSALLSFIGIIYVGKKITLSTSNQFNKLRRT